MVYMTTFLGDRIVLLTYYKELTHFMISLDPNYIKRICCKVEPLIHYLLLFQLVTSLNASVKDLVITSPSTLTWDQCVTNIWIYFGYLIIYAQIFYIWIQILIFIALETPPACLWYRGQGFGYKNKQTNKGSNLRPETTFE